MRIFLASFACVAVLLSGCSIPKPRLPRVFKLSVQQGNVITQTMVDQLKPGMTRSQVAFIMGEPVIRNSFNEDRWDYIYTLELPGIFDTNQTVSLFFVDDVLGYFTGDLVPSAEQDTPASSEGAEDAEVAEGPEVAEGAEATASPEVADPDRFEAAGSESLVGESG